MRFGIVHQVLWTPSWYSQDNAGCSDTEALVLAALLLRPATADDAAEWAIKVVGDSGDYVAGAPWNAPASWNGAEQKVITGKFDVLTSKLEVLDVQAAARAVAQYDGAGRWPTELCDSSITSYVSDLKLKRRKPRALYGRGTKKDPPMRRTYILPRVARIVHEKGAALKALLDASADSRQDDGIRRGVTPGRACPEMKKDELKRVLADKENTIEDLELAVAHQTKLKQQALRRGAETRENIAAAVTRRTEKAEQRAAAVASAAEASARAEVAATVEAVMQERDAANARAATAEGGAREWRAKALRAEKLRSDPVALKRLCAETQKLRAENLKLRVAAVANEREAAAAREAAKVAREEYGEVNLAKRPRGKGARRGRPHPASLRVLFMKLLCVCCVPPTPLAEVFASCAEVRVARGRRARARACSARWRHTARARATHVATISLPRAS